MPAASGKLRQSHQHQQPDAAMQLLSGTADSRVSPTITTISPSKDFHSALQVNELDTDEVTTILEGSSNNAMRMRHYNDQLMQ